MAKKQYNKKISEAVDEATGDVVTTYIRVEEEVPDEVLEPKVDFDAWFALRGAKIPKAHHKEVIKADFKGRGLSQVESIKDFDAALVKYGVKLD